MNNSSTNTNGSTIKWKPILIIVSVVIAGILIWVFSQGYFTKQKLMNGRWKLTYMETDDARLKEAFKKSQSNSDPDFMVMDISGQTSVTFIPDDLFYGCKIKANAIVSIDGITIFQIVELTDRKLELEQCVINHGPFGPYRIMGGGKRLSFINLNKEEFHPTVENNAVDTTISQGTYPPTVEKKQSKAEREETNRKLDALMKQFGNDPLSSPSKDNSKPKKQRGRYSYIVCMAFWDNSYYNKDPSFAIYVSDVVSIDNTSKDNIARIRDNAESQIRTKLHGKEKTKVTAYVETLYKSYDEASSAMHAALSEKNGETFHYDGYFHSIE